MEVIWLTMCDILWISYVNGIKSYIMHVVKLTTVSTTWKEASYKN